MRKPRLLQKGAKYHVSAKINRSEHIFESDEIKKLFMNIVKRSKKKYKFSLYNFVVMNNHIHFIIRRFNLYLLIFFHFLMNSNSQKSYR
jgi:REP element-mobilizing transposase RayT